MYDHITTQQTLIEKALAHLYAAIGNATGALEDKIQGRIEALIIEAVQGALEAGENMLPYQVAELVPYAGPADQSGGQWVIIAGFSTYEAADMYLEQQRARDASTKYALYIDRTRADFDN